MSEAELYALHSREVRAFARSLVRNDADADDVVAATFEVLPRAARGRPEAAASRSFVFAVCANIARRLLRSRARRHRALERLAVEPDAASAESAADPESAAMRRELADAIARALEELPPEQREALVLTSVADMPAAEVARLQGVPEATIRTRVFHARRKLRDALTLRGSRGAPRALGPLVAVLATVILIGSTVYAATHAPAVRAFVRRVVAMLVGSSSSSSSSSSSRPADPAASSTAATSSPALVGPSGAAPVPGVSPAAPARGDEGGEAPSARRTAPLPPPAAPAPPRTDAAPPPAHRGAHRAPESASRGAPNRGDPAAALASTLYARAHDLHFHARDYRAALAAWNDYLASSVPEGRLLVEARYNRAMALVRLGRFREARLALTPFAAGAYAGYRRAEAARVLDALARAESARDE